MLHLIENHNNLHCIGFLSLLSSMAVQAPSGAARWGILLAESISKQFELLRNDLRETKSSIQNIDAKFDALSERILDDVKEAKTLAKEAHDIALAAKAANEKLEEKVVRLEQSLFEVKKQKQWFSTGEH